MLKQGENSHHFDLSGAGVPPAVARAFLRSAQDRLCPCAAAGRSRDRGAGRPRHARPLPTRFHGFRMPVSGRAWTRPTDRPSCGPRLFPTAAPEPRTEKPAVCATQYRPRSRCSLNLRGACVYTVRLFTWAFSPCQGVTRSPKALGRRASHPSGSRGHQPSEAGERR